MIVILNSNLIQLNKINIGSLKSMIQKSITKIFIGKRILLGGVNDKLHELQMP